MRIGFKFDQMKKQGPSVKCERCNLSYFQKHNDKCPHCAELNDQVQVVFGLYVPMGPINMIEIGS